MSLGSSTAEMLQDNMVDSDDWGAAERIASLKKGTGSAVAVTGSGSADHPVDENHSTLELESSWLMRTGSEPTNEEIIEYLDKFRLQAFLTDAIMYVARHMPPDPFDFLLNHMEAMVMKHRASETDKVLGSKQDSKVALSSPPPPTLTPDQQEKVVQHVVTVLQHPQLTNASAEKLFNQFAKGTNKTLDEAEFAMFLRHIESSWGMDGDDTKFMFDVLKRWRFRQNAATGTRGLPLWPLSRGDFLSAYPCLLRAVRDRYVPIGGAIHVSLFVRKATGSLADKYDLGPRIGRGAYGEVLLVTQQETKERRVCKRVAQHRQRVPSEELEDEISLLRGLDHPHIVHLFEYFETEEDVEMIMEPVFGGTLTQLVRGLYCDEAGELLGRRPPALGEAWLAGALSQLLGALRYAHETIGVVHKDLKCDNVLLVGRPNLTAEETLKEPLHVMLADFGIAEIFSTATLILNNSGTGNGSLKSATPGGGTAGGRSRSSRVGGTPSYMSPEMFKGSFTEKSDIWSLGVMAFQLMTGELPYRGENLLMQAHIVCCPRRHPRWEVLSQYKWGVGARWLCQQLLSKDEAMRPSAAEALKTDWLAKVGALRAEVATSPADRATLQHQHLRSHLMRMALTCITSQLSLSQLHHLNLRFRQYDGTGDGRLSHAEIRQVLDDVGVAGSEDVELIIESLDSDGSGLIEYSEFIAGSIDLGCESVRRHLRVAFDIFDLDGSGAISQDELRQVLTTGPNGEELRTRTSGRPWGGATGMLPDGATVDEVMKDLDANRTGRVEYAEFEAYLFAEHARTGEALHVSRTHRRKAGG